MVDGNGDSQGSYIVLGMVEKTRKCTQGTMPTAYDKIGTFTLEKDNSSLVIRD